jgi:hypothetical protein
MKGPGKRNNYARNRIRLRAIPVTSLLRTAAVTF